MEDINLGYFYIEDI